MIDSSSDLPVEERLQDFLSYEVRQAEVDFPNLTARGRPDPRLGPGMAVASVLILVVVAFLVWRPLSVVPGVAGSSSGTTAGLSPRPTVSPSASEAALWSDGIPRVVAGEPVLRGQAIATHIAAATADTSFLVGGYVVFIEADCYVPPNLPSSPLTAPCDDGWTLRDMLGFHIGSPSTTSGPPPTSYRLVLGSSVPGWAEPISSPIVLRVHAHDQRAASCAASITDKCERAIVVESVVWSEPPSLMPPAVANRLVLPTCGTERTTTPHGPWNEAARACFVDAYRAQRPAEFVSTSLTTEGDPITSIYRVLPAGQIEIFIDSTQDRFAGNGRGWQQLECSTLFIADSPGSPVPAIDLGPDNTCVATSLP